MVPPAMALLGKKKLEKLFDSQTIYRNWDIIPFQFSSWLVYKDDNFGHYYTALNADRLIP